MHDVIAHGTSTIQATTAQVQEGSAWFVRLQCARDDGTPTACAADTAVTVTVAFESSNTDISTPWVPQPPVLPPPAGVSLLLVLSLVTAAAVVTALCVLMLRRRGYCLCVGRKRSSGSVLDTMSYAAVSTNEDDDL